MHHKADGLLPEQVPFTATLRRWIIEQARASNVGHIGSALSIVEIIAVLWGGVLRHPASKESVRDRFILAKGHAALALYAALRYLGHIDARAYDTFCRDDTLLGTHPEYGLPGVEISTGSLGQGLSVGCGQALALQGQPGQPVVYVLVSDAECNEGQVWEAAMFAAHHQLSNLVVIVDDNGMQALGPTRDVLDLSPMAQRWRAFGWQAVEADGHDEDSLRAALNVGIAGRRGPAVVIARTVLGRGISFMENRLEWHYRNLTAELTTQALAELGVCP